jgi:hypothetical protein
MTGTPSRLLGGIAAAWAAVIGVAFLSGCVYPFVLDYLVNGKVTFQTAGILEGCFLVGTVVALSAIPVATVVALGVAPPLFLAMRRNNYASLWAYYVAGLLLSFSACALIAALHYFSTDFLSEFDFNYAICTMIVAGPVAALTVRHVATRQ